MVAKTNSAWTPAAGLLPAGPEIVIALLLISLLGVSSLVVLELVKLANLQHKRRQLLFGREDDQLIDEAVALIKSEAPEWYAFLTSRRVSIRFGRSYTVSRYWPTFRRHHHIVRLAQILRRASPALRAAIIIHELRHAQLVERPLVRLAILQPLALLAVGLVRFFRPLSGWMEAVVWFWVLEIAILTLTQYRRREASAASRIQIGRAHV